MNFIETRGNDGIRKKEVTFSEALLNPSASFGGLYVPKELPQLSESFFEEAKNLNYKELTLKILDMFDLDIDREVLKEAVSLYDKFDDPNDPVPVKKIENDLFVIELYHGPTRAFKDMALQPFGHILSHLAKEKNEKYLILAATSGDTGPATLETFKNKDNILVSCLYPEGGTSDIQKLQMVTNDGKNVKVIGIVGNFDDAQSALKSLLASKAFKEELTKDHIKLSAANSVNFGRIIFQIIYHIKSYIDLLKKGEIDKKEKIYIIVPSGNFGNALGAYYAKKMGTPIEKILIASNINNILTDLITKGEYDLRDRKLLQTTSPAMDILKSSNVERMLFDLFGAERTKELMDSLNNENYYKLTEEELQKVREHFDATFCDDEFAKETIREYAKKGYVMDPHTATSLKAYKELKKEPLKCVACSTAEWTKFAPTMLNALKNDDKKYSDKEALEEISKTLHIEIPQIVKELFEKEIVHKTVVETDKIEEEILNFIQTHA
ncbi:MAG: threonine synthase [Epsilonproteobacteria bacterium]|nr:threonine synthase [Campylobacterota bacterium]